MEIMNMGTNELRNEMDAARRIAADPSSSESERQRAAKWAAAAQRELDEREERRKAGEHIWQRIKR